MPEGQHPGGWGGQEEGQIVPAQHSDGRVRETFRDGGQPGGLGLDIIIGKDQDLPRRREHAPMPAGVQTGFRFLKIKQVRQGRGQGMNHRGRTVAGAIVHDQDFKMPGREGLSGEGG